MNRIHRGTRPLFLLAVTAALAFGATQAAAAPDPAARAQVCTKIYYGIWCSEGAEGACANFCAQAGYASYKCSDDPLRPRSCCACRI